jgi:hypothetical protein
VKKSAEKTPPPASEAEREELQELEALALGKVKAGYVVVKLKVQGYRVVDAEVLSQPESRLHANRRQLMETVKLQAEHLQQGEKS